MERNKNKRIHNHNIVQVEYFERGIKSTMVPEETHYISRHVDELIKFANIKTKDRILEVGCGMGRHTLKIASKGIKIEGLDLTRFLLDKLEEFNNGRYEIPLYCSDVINHPPELDNRYDAVIGFFTLHHVHDISECYREMTRMVKKGGCIVFLEPNAMNPLYYIQILITPGMSWAGDGGMMKMRKKIIFDAMKGAGLSDLQLYRFGFFPPFLSNKSWGAKLESCLELFPLWHSLLPFQLFKGIKK